MEILPVAKRKMKSLYKRMFKPKYSIVFLPTFRCNFRCRYCTVIRDEFYKVFPKKEEKSWNEWVDILNKFSPAHIEVSGGEPFVYKDINKLINNLDPKNRIFLTSNFSAPLEEILKINNNVGMTISYHKGQINDDDLKDKVALLREKGYIMNATFVPYPKSVDQIPEARRFVEEELRIPFSIIPFLDPEYEYTPEELEKEKSLIESYGIYKYDVENRRKKLCRAGMKNFIILPNGDAYTCFEGFYAVHSRTYSGIREKKEKFYMGNLFDNSFELRKSRMVCTLPCAQVCDRTNVDIEVLGE